jgi:tight adherence protein B
MLTPLVLAIIVLLLVGSSSTVLLIRDIGTARLRERVGAMSARLDGQVPSASPVRPLVLRADSSERMARFLRFLRFNPDIPQQNVIAWKLVLAISTTAALVGFFYGRAFLGWPLALLLMPVEGVLIARCIFSWERARFQKALLEQVPDVMGLICRALGAGIPLTEALRSVAHESSLPSRAEFLRVVNEVAIGQPLEAALWRLHKRSGLPEYAFFAVTISLQAQTGGSLVETLENLQDLVRKRVGLSKRGKALAAEARLSGIVLSSLPIAIGILLSFTSPGFLDFFFNTPSGTRLLLVAAGLLTMGILMMRQLIRRSLAP